MMARCCIGSWQPTRRSTRRTRWRNSSVGWSATATRAASAIGWTGHGPAAYESLRGFADHLQRDRPAVDAALTLPWSNGQTEGQITRLKLLKRQIYGRAGFDLLRRLVLLAA